MILSRQIHSIVFVLLLYTWLTAAQNLRKADDGESVTKTVIDVLSENVQFSTFLRVLQRRQLIPFLNELTNITLVAPVNSAFVTSNDSKAMQEDNNNADIEQFTLDELKRYIITRPVISGDFTGSRIFNTYYHNNSPVLVKSYKANDTFEVNGIGVVEPDCFAESQDSVVQGIENLFQDILPTESLLKDLEDTSIFQHLVQNRDSFNKTYFVPIDDAFGFNDYEVNYLKSDFGSSDSIYLLNSLSVDGIFGGDLNVSVKDHNGCQTLLSSKDSGDHILINHTIPSFESNLLAQNSILHIFNNNELIPKIEMNPLKVMVGLNASGLVDELILQKLERLITNNSIEQTIFIANQENNQLYTTSKNSNLYHFVDERIESLSEKSRVLYNTKFCSSKKLGPSCQKVKIEENKPGNYTLNGNTIVTNGPFYIGETVIYITDDDLRTPNELTSSINPIYHCSKSLKHMETLGLLKLSANSLGYTYFLPCYDSWDDFELTANYFQQNSTALELLMKHFVLNGLFYSDFEEFDTISFKNLNEEVVKIEYDGSKEDKNGMQEMCLKYNNVDFDLKVNDDILYSQGVIHPIEKLIFPKGLNVNLKDIITSSDIGLFIDLVDKASEIDSNEVFESQKYSVLLPSLKSLERNLPFESNSTLEKFLKLHIIKPSSLNNLYSCSGNIETLLGVNLTCSKISGKGDFFLQIDEESDNGVRVLSKGCTNSENHNCVFAIDRSISLNWLDNHEHYHLTLPGVALAIGVLVGVVVMVFIFVCLMLFVARRKDSFVSHTHEEPETNENTPLLTEAENSNDTDSHGKNIGNTTPNFGQNYSYNTLVNPIRMSNPANREPNMS